METNCPYLTREYYDGFIYDREKYDGFFENPPHYPGHKFTCDRPFNIFPITNNYFLKFRAKNIIVYRYYSFYNNFLH